MTQFNYNEDAPDPNNDPSDDVSDMHTNTEQNARIWEEDHTGFNVDPGGVHKRVTLSVKSAPGAQTDPSSTLYTASGTASSVADLFYKNQNGTFRPNIIKAAGSFNGQAANGVVPIISGYNISSVNKSSPAGAVYTVTLTSGAVIGTTAIILDSVVPQGNLTSVALTASDTLTFTFSSGAGGQNSAFKFALLQV